MEINDVAMRHIQNGLDGVVSGYLEHFVKKFENLSNQMRIADILLNAYSYRYDKIEGKIKNVDDVIANDKKNHENINNKLQKLVNLEQKMFTIEQKLGLINDKVDKLLDDCGLGDKK